MAATSNMLSQNRVSRSVGRSAGGGYQQHAQAARLPGIDPQNGRIDQKRRGLLRRRGLGLAALTHIDPRLQQQRLAIHIAHDKFRAGRVA